jgi:hypothetical protein
LSFYSSIFLSFSLQYSHTLHIILLLFLGYLPVFFSYYLFFLFLPIFIFKFSFFI